MESWLRQGTSLARIDLPNRSKALTLVGVFGSLSAIKPRIGSPERGPNKRSVDKHSASALAYKLQSQEASHQNHGTANCCGRGDATNAHSHKPSIHQARLSGQSLPTFSPHSSFALAEGVVNAVDNSGRAKFNCNTIIPRCNAQTLEHTTSNRSSFK